MSTVWWLCVAPQCRHNLVHYGWNKECLLCGGCVWFLSVATNWSITAETNCVYCVVAMCGSWVSPQISPLWLKQTVSAVWWLRVAPECRHNLVHYGWNKLCLLCGGCMWLLSVATIWSITDETNWVYCVVAVCGSWVSPQSCPLRMKQTVSTVWWVCVVPECRHKLVQYGWNKLCLLCGGYVWLLSVATNWSTMAETVSVWWLCVTPECCHNLVHYGWNKLCLLCGSCVQFLSVATNWSIMAKSVYCVVAVCGSWASPQSGSFRLERTPHSAPTSF